MAKLKFESRENHRRANIKSAHYDLKTKQLIIHFSSGRSYSYENVHPETVKSLERAESRGTYFHQHIRPGHPATEIFPNKDTPSS